MQVGNVVVGKYETYPDIMLLDAQKLWRGGIKWAEKNDDLQALDSYKRLLRKVNEELRARGQ